MTSNLETNINEYGIFYKYWLSLAICAQVCWTPLGACHSNPDQAWFTNRYCTDHTVASAFFILLSVKVVWSNFVCTNNFKTTQVLGTKLFAPFIMANDKVLFELKSFYYLIFWSEPWDHFLDIEQLFRLLCRLLTSVILRVWVPAPNRECQN